MAKIYVLECGEYSDRQITEVTTDKELAEALVKIHSTDWYPWDMTEYDDAKDNGEMETANSMVKMYTIYLKQDGSISRTTECYVLKDRQNEYEIDDRHYSFIAKVVSDDLNTAIKIARDKRAKMIAERMGL